LKEFKPYKLKFSSYLEKLYNSDKPLIIYKVNDGYNLYTDFSKKIILTNNNINNFFNLFSKKKHKKETDLYIGFFGYEILCNLLNIKIKNQKKLRFYKGVFYKPETLIKIRKDIKVISSKKNQVFRKFFNKTKILSPFKLNINYKKYQKIFDVFSKKIKQGETYQIIVCTKYKPDSKINPIFGIKQKILRETEPKKLIHFMRKTVKSMLKKGTTTFVDFREGGLDGVLLMQKVLSTLQFVP